jgi:hypothetical protein
MTDQMPGLGSAERMNCPTATAFSPSVYPALHLRVADQLDTMKGKRCGVTEGQ